MSESKALSQVVETAAKFVESIIIPPAAEIGLLIKDQISSWRFHNQVNILDKAQKKCISKGITSKVISPKLLAPLLDYCSLEEDPVFQDKWASLLVNMVDSNANMTNHVFPYLLSQISIQEMTILESLYAMEQKRRYEARTKLSNFEEQLPKTKSKLNDQLGELSQNLELILKSGNKEGYWEAVLDKQSVEKEISNIDSEHKRLLGQLAKKVTITDTKVLEDHEWSNLIRLGLIKEIRDVYGYVDQDAAPIMGFPKSGFSLSNETEIDLRDLPISIELEKPEFLMTRLGELLVEACSDNRGRSK
jgi:hypothetical protein